MNAFKTNLKLRNWAVFGISNEDMHYFSQLLVKANASQLDAMVREINAERVARR